MKRLTYLTASLCLAGNITLTAQVWAAADTVFVSNHVLTMNERSAEPMAVAVTADRISWIGAVDDYTGQIDRKTEVVQLGEQALLPGFIDAHGHASFLALTTQLANISSPPVGPVETIADLQNQLRAYIDERNLAPGDWVISQGYDDSLLAENRHPDRDDLDAVSTEHPIYLIHVSGHLGAANSRALGRAGISSESPNPSGGIIRRRPGTQEPNGVLEESASYPLRKYTNSVVKDPIGNVRAAMATYARNGITTAQDGAASKEVIDLMKAADKAGQVDLDVVIYPAAQRDPEGMMAFAYGTYDGRVKIGGVKLMLDGSPQGKTAFMTEPYLHPPHGQDAEYRGYPAIPQVRVNDLVAKFGHAGIPMIAHTNGDAAADMLITAVREANIQTDHRTVMIHAQTVREDQLTDMKTLGMIPSFFAAHSFYWGDWHRDSVFGETRALRISPTASTMARGMIFTVHNDAPIVPPDMIRLLWATTNRITRSGKVLGKNQRISTYDALRAMTIFAAHQNFEESDKGSIEVGKYADFAILSENPLLLAPEDLLDLRVNATYSHGVQVYDRKEP
ncbi:MAG: amidohydrolase family protein [Pseudomonadales bacterium]|nr:amidohydrolase family protein [Pseudomonadales bacterium]